MTGSIIYAFLRRLVIPRALRKVERVSGLAYAPADQAFIIAANHVSWLDPIYITAVIGQRFHGPILFIGAAGKHNWTGGVIPIDRNQPGACLQIALQELDRGRVVGIFPRGDPRKHAPAKTGVARLARWSGLPVVPIAIRDTSPGHVLRSIYEYFSGTRSMRLAIGQALQFEKTKDVSREQLQEDTQKIQYAIEALLATL